MHMEKLILDKVTARPVATAAAVGSVGVALFAAYKIWSNARLKVRNVNLHGGQLVAEVLKAHGVEFIFTLIGGHISPIIVGAKAAGVRVIDVRHEVTAVFAADAVARLTGVPGVACVTAGPGVTNTITAIKNAQMAEVPLVLLGGAAATLTKGRGSLQDIDQISVLKPIVKWAVSVERVRDIVPTLRKAFQIASSGVPGPVFVELPIDILYSVFEVQANMGLIERKRAKDFQNAGKGVDLSSVILPEGFETGLDDYLASLPRPDTPVFVRRAHEELRKKVSWFVEQYLQYKLRDLFGNGFECMLEDCHTKAAAFAPLAVKFPTPSNRDVRKVAQLLSTAKRPVLLVASQAMLLDCRSAGGVVCATDLANAVKSLGMPTFLGGMARGLLPPGHRQLFRHVRKQALAEADVVILAGSVCDFRLDYGRALSRKSKIVIINRNYETLYKNSDLFWSPHMACLSDPGAFLLSLAAELRSYECPPSWLAALSEKEQAKEACIRDRCSAPAFGHGEYESKELLNPLALLRTLDEKLPDNAILIGDGGDFVATAAYITKPRAPLSWLDPGAFGTLGVGMGFALGAKLVRPESEVWLLWGDGSAGYSIAEYDTAIRHGISVIALVGNDAAWSQIEREQLPILGDNVACPLEYTPYDIVARGYGGTGEMIHATDEASVASAIDSARVVALQGKPVLLNALIGKTDFREGSLSV